MRKRRRPIRPTLPSRIGTKGVAVPPSQSHACLRPNLKLQYTATKTSLFGGASLSPQEYLKFCTFTNALLSRSNKLTDLIASMEFELGSRSKDSTEGKRVEKSRTYRGAISCMVQVLGSPFNPVLSSYL